MDEHRRKLYENHDTNDDEGGVPIRLEQIEDDVKGRLSFHAFHQPALHHFDLADCGRQQFAGGAHQVRILFQGDYLARVPGPVQEIKQPLPPGAGGGVVSVYLSMDPTTKLAPSTVCRTLATQNCQSACALARALR